MSTLREKSNLNIKAALTLTSTVDICSTSVHCSYYSCYQLIIHFLETKLNIDKGARKNKYDIYVKGVRDAGGSKILGSHEYWIQQFINDYKQKKSNEVPFIYKNLMQLRQARLEADYEATDFSKKNTDELYDVAFNVRKMIIKTYES